VFPLEAKDFAGSQTAVDRRPALDELIAGAEVLQADDELAFLLSHEMGHASDPEPNASGNPRTDPYSEHRADALGIVFMMRAGYDPRSAGRGLQVLQGQRGQGNTGESRRHARSHR
jgi:predicted Zn-dependent protease